MILSTLIVALIVLLTALALYQAKPMKASAKGKIISDWHVVANLAHNAPTVVFETGLDTSGHIGWQQVVEHLPKHYNTLTYDRLGYGFSSAANSPRTASNMAQELQQLLVAANAPGPYILVGHSLGGLIVQMFANKHPELVQAVILVDSSHPKQASTFPIKKVNIHKVPPRWLFMLLHKLGIVRWQLKKMLGVYSLPITRIMDYLNRGVDNMHQELAELNNSLEKAAQVTSLGEIPLIVIAGTNVEKRGTPTKSLSSQAVQNWWITLQQDYLTRSTNSKLVNASNSGHLVLLDEPELVAKEIIKTMQQLSTQDVSDQVCKR